MLIRVASVLFGVASGIAVIAPANALILTRPMAGEVIAAGDDYATQALGNAWDMADSADIDTQESTPYISPQSFGSGLFSGTTTINGAGVYPLFMGFGSSINLGLNRGPNFPIDTSHYRYATVKWRVNASAQTLLVYYLLDANSLGTSTFGTAGFYPNPQVAPNQWVIGTIDLADPAVNSGPIQWTTHPALTGLRVDPANATGVSFNIDWIRLTAPATNSQKYTVQWTDSGYSGSYTVSAIDVGAYMASYTLSTTASGLSLLADMTFLSPGQYQIQVKRNGDGLTATGGTFHINTPAQVSVINPGGRGEQSKGFAAVVVGNPWGPIDAGDSSQISNFTNVVYNNPPGSFYGRPTNSDPGWYMNQGGHAIDTSVYRSLCFTLQVFGPRSVGAGSIARVFWGSGNTGATLTTSWQVPLDDVASPSEYCIADLAAIPLEANPNGGLWSGTKSAFRVDPSEWQPAGGCSTPATCHDVRLDSVVLAPFAAANPSYTISWLLTDPDPAAGGSVRLLLNPSRTNDLSQSVTIATLPYVTGAQQYRFTTKRTIPNATYYIGVQATDAVNTVLQYSDGPIMLDNSDVIFNDGFDG